MHTANSLVIYLNGQHMYTILASLVLHASISTAAGIKWHNDAGGSEALACQRANSNSCWGLHMHKTVQLASSYNH